MVVAGCNTVRCRDLEAETGVEFTLPERWVWYREKQAGQVSYRLARRE
jgi:hypothetical protein